MIQKNALAKVLRTLATTIESMADEDVALLLAGKGKLTFIPSEKPKNVHVEPSIDHAVLMTRLNDCRDRDEARQVLLSVATKDALMSLAKGQKLYIAKNDRREDIENKIIEFVIGAKLRTEAIQTLSLTGGGNQADG
ncbi:hypothetical protein C8R26_11071 [Nitrosomonas oligotropha]|uniref:Uncharacterized protein n=1 Tax=Nitrosomonas oligotropha TaxID=42354 RepID=A0A2T5I005_9PROT|nr:hypothetical protein [Nitrosomonas oligotropha]PTQ77151.1 hypothetical protein C8R26_11071 [Nitrosomonas oligotropha]